MTVAPGRAADPAAGGEPLLGGAESAVATVVGRVGEPQQVDLHGWATQLRVDQVLAGELTSGAEVRITWEELASGRPVRFQKDQRILVALDPLPGSSLWRKRFPDGQGLAIAARGDAFLRSPDPVSVVELESYLALAPEERKGEAGVEALARLTALADPTLARAAVARLDTVPGLDAKVTPAGRASFARTLSTARPEEIRRGLLALVERRELRSLRSIVAPLAREGSPLRAEALAALVALDGGLPSEQVLVLLENDDAGVRVVAVRQALGRPEEARLASLVSADPAPEVRLEAVKVLLGARGAEALDDVTPALFDPDPEVRTLASSEIGKLGAPSVQVLDQLARARSGQEAVGPLMALSQAGPWGRQALGVIAQEHPDKQVRRMALFFLGRGVGH